MKYRWKKIELMNANKRNGLEWKKKSYILVSAGSIVATKKNDTRKICKS